MTGGNNLEMQENVLPEVCIIVLNWERYELTKECVHSLTNLQYPKYRIIVVDNGSSTCTVEKLRKEFDGEIDLIENSENLGFSGGNNVGIRQALISGARYIMILNNDTRVHPAFLFPLIRALRSSTRVGAVTPKIYSLHEPDRIWASGGQIRWWLGQAKSRGRGQLDHGQFDQAQSVDYGTGCCLLFDRRALEEVGLLDERYFAYWEDTDWCMRARRAGFSIWYEPESHIWHAGGASTHDQRKKRPFAYYLMIRNNIWFIKCYTSKWIRPLAALTFTFHRVLFYSLGFLALRRWRKLRNIWLGVRDGLRGPIHVSDSSLLVSLRQQEERDLASEC